MELSGERYLDTFGADYRLNAHGLLIMRERRVKACWSTDRHLGLTGVRLVN